MKYQILYGTNCKTFIHRNGVMKAYEGAMKIVKRILYAIMYIVLLVYSLQ